MSPTAPVPAPSSSTDRRRRAWAPSPANPGVSRYLERTMAASHTTQPTPPEPYCCSRNAVPSLFSKTRTKFPNGSSAEDSRAASMAARQQKCGARTDVTPTRPLSPASRGAPRLLVAELEPLPAKAQSPEDSVTWAWPSAGPPASPASWTGKLPHSPKLQVWFNEQAA